MSLTGVCPAEEPFPEDPSSGMISSSLSYELENDEVYRSSGSIRLHTWIIICISFANICEHMFGIEHYNRGHRNGELQFTWILI
jgi:hypothetical protein